MDRWGIFLLRQPLDTIERPRLGVMLVRFELIHAAKEWFSSEGMVHERYTRWIRGIGEY